MKYELNKWYKVYDTTTLDVTYIYLLNYYSLYSVTFDETQSEPYTFEFYKKISFKEFSEYFINKNLRITEINEQSIIIDCFKESE